ncbi:MAG TPA: transglutaminase family protein [Solirubrobacteraceae bacterium]|nr:transglutaminase family protein [Solirubrobacteraceae bacterium]
MTTYTVTHRTEYVYESAVAPSYSQLHLLPRDLPGQRCRSAEVVVDPEPEDYRERSDFFGNRVAYVAIHEPHVRLTVTSTSVVDVDGRDQGVTLLAQRPWEEARDALADPHAAERLDAAQFVLDSPLVAATEAYADYALHCFTPGRELLAGVIALCSQIHADFAYVPGSTSVSTPLTEVFETREGVCQDFAHVGIACLRSIGLPARYVSGYIATDPPPGKPKLIGADFSHAWLSLLVPGAGWLDVDPTNDQLVSHRHVVTAFGRDYSDVPPLTGVIFTEGKTKSLKVTVDVAATPISA